MGHNRSERLGNRNPQIPSLLYHGTCLGYVDASVKKTGHYSQETYLIYSPVSAIGYAIKRVDFYKDWPALLMVDTRRIESPNEPRLKNGQWISPGLNLESCLVLPAKLNKDGQFDVLEWLRRVQSLTRRIHSIPAEEILRRNHKILASRFANIFKESSQAMLARSF